MNAGWPVATLLKEALVLKPNRSYGGDSVYIGHILAQEEWDAAVDRALADKERWVAQRLASIPVSEFRYWRRTGRCTRSRSTR